MFTGIIKEVGKVRYIKTRSGYKEIGIQTKDLFKEVNPGDSVSINGTCLTLVSKNRETIFFDVSNHTLNSTNLRYLKIGDYVNIEKSISFKELLGGHLVYGHIDKVLKIVDIKKEGQMHKFYFPLEDDFKKFIFKNASVSIEGISLTVAGLDKKRWWVNIIPYTFRQTNFSFKKVGDKVNVEFDYIVKVVDNLLKHGR